MNVQPATLLLFISAACSLGLGVAVLFRNPYRWTHRAYALVAANLAIWAVSVLYFIRAETVEQARFWCIARAMAAVFIPLTFSLFAAVFPKQRFRELRALFYLHTICAPLFLIGVYRLWIPATIQLRPGAMPIVPYGTLLYAFFGWLAVTFSVLTIHLIRKARQASGLERRQIEHVLAGGISTLILMGTTNLLAPILHEGDLTGYGPIWALALSCFVGYAMIRYHLLDVSDLITRTALYSILTAITIVLFLGTVSLVNWAFGSWGPTRGGLQAFLAALVVVVLLQPLKEWLQRLLDQRILTREYDTNRLMQRISQFVAQSMHLDGLLRTVAEDVRAALGARSVRMLLVDAIDPEELIIGYSTVPDETGKHTRDFLLLESFARVHSEPILLEPLLLERPEERRVRLAQMLAEADIFLCVPLRTNFGVAGFLALGPKVSGDTYAQDDVALLSVISGPLAAAMENARLRGDLEKANLHLSQILDNMRGGLIAVNEEGVITTVNPSAIEILGAIRQGQSLDELPPQVAEVLRGAIQERRFVQDYEITITRGQGVAIPLVFSSAALDVAEGGAFEVIAVFYDLSPIRRLEEHIQRAQRLSSIGILAAGMAHEIKNPLASIKTFSTLLPAQYDDPEFRETLAEVLPREVDRINELVMRLLDFARPRPVQPKPQTIEPILAQVLELLDTQIRKHNVQIKTVWDLAKGEVYGDEQQFRQIFFNLIVNALDAMETKGGGTLTLQTRYVKMRLQRDAMLGPRDRDCVQVTVRDTGCGISQESLSQIFTPFFSTKASSRGLGLAVAHGMAGELGGEIDVSSTLGEGTVFIVTFPIYNRNAGDAHPAL